MPDNEPSTAQLTRQAIAAEVRAELARQNKTQRDLGAALGLHQSSVQLRLTGERAFRGEELAIMAGWLGVSVERFLLIPVAAASSSAAGAA